MPPPPNNEGFAFDLADLLHPAQAFKHPRDVLGDADLTLNEKRAILTSWASDMRAVEVSPAHSPPGARQAVSADEVLQALRSLDHAVGVGNACTAWAQRQARRQAFEHFRARRWRGRQDPGSALPR